MRLGTKYVLFLAHHQLRCSLEELRETGTASHARAPSEEFSANHHATFRRQHYASPIAEAVNRISVSPIARQVHPPQGQYALLPPGIASSRCYRHCSYGLSNCDVEIRAGKWWIDCLSSGCSDA